MTAVLTVMEWCIARASSLARGVTNDGAIMTTCDVTPTVRSGGGWVVVSRMCRHLLSDCAHCYLSGRCTAESQVQTVTAAARSDGFRHGGVSIFGVVA